MEASDSTFSKWASEAKEYFEKFTILAVYDPRGICSSGYASSAGWYLVEFMSASNAPRDERFFELIDDRLLRIEPLKQAFVRGFGEAVHSRYDEDEERFPGSERSIRLEKERENFCCLFATYVTRKVARLALTPPRKEEVLHRIVREAKEQRIVVSHPRLKPWACNSTSRADQAKNAIKCNLR